MTPTRTEHRRRMREALAPGTRLREGLERIVQGRTGALIVVGSPRSLAPLATGGFDLDVAFSPTALRELAKMDGAIVCTADVGRIVAAGVHLSPDPHLPTDETGTRHRTADRLSQQLHLPVITVSASMGTIAVYIEGTRIVIDPPSSIFPRLTQALQTLWNYRDRWQEAARRLDILEVQDQVAARDVATVLLRFDMARRIADEVRDLLLSLGDEGRVARLQLESLTQGMHDFPGLIGRDYGVDTEVVPTLDEATVLDVAALSRELGFPSPEERVAPAGFRQLKQGMRLPASVIERLLGHFGGLQALLGASIADLRDVEGVGQARARLVREGLTRVADAPYA